MLGRIVLFTMSAALLPVWADSSALLSCEQKEEVLRGGLIKAAKTANKGVTATSRVSLSYGNVNHDASVQRIDEEKAMFQGNRGAELGFRDTYRFNIAAYRLGRLLGLEHMIPVSVERSFQGSHASFTWWVEDVMMDEGDRIKNKVAVPNKEEWARQYQIMKVFDQLIYNTDRNMQNALWDKEWHLWMIDHSRAFRNKMDLYEPKSLERCDRVLLERMKMLTSDQVKKALGDYVRPSEIKGLMARRDKIVKYFEGFGEEKLYEFLPK